MANSSPLSLVQSDILEKMVRNPQGDWTIKDVQTVCEQHKVACEPPRGGGSHYKVWHPRISHIQTIPSRRPIKTVYIRRFVQFIAAVRRLT
jgi:hypothetical protein